MFFAVTSEKKKELVRVIKYVLFSASAGLIQLLSFTLLNELTHWSYWPCYLIALTLSVLWNFTLNRQFTFKAANNVPLAMLKVFLYYCAFTPLSTWWGDALTKAGWNEYVVLVGTMLVNFVTEYLFYQLVVFRNSIDTNALARRQAEAEAEKQQSTQEQSVEEHG